jgi:hypothetical protein
MKNRYEIGSILARGSDSDLHLAIERCTSDSVVVKKKTCNNLLEVNEAMDEAVMLSRMVNCDYIAQFRNMFIESTLQDGMFDPSSNGCLFRFPTHSSLAVGKQAFEVYIVTEYASGGDMFSILR